MLRWRVTPPTSTVLAHGWARSRGASGHEISTCRWRVASLGDRGQLVRSIRPCPSRNAISPAVGELVRPHPVSRLELATWIAGPLTSRSSRNCPPATGPANLDRPRARRDRPIPSSHRLDLELIHGSVPRRRPTASLCPDSPRLRPSAPAGRIAAALPDFPQPADQRLDLRPADRDHVLDRLLDAS